MNPDGGVASLTVSPGTAVGRYGQSEEIASMVAYLASAEAGFVAGADIIVDGGFTA